MKDKIFTCQDCKKKFRVKAYTPEVVAMKLCPQCYTKRMVAKGSYIKIDKYAKERKLK